MSRPRAAVDSGSNSTRLLVVDADGRDVVRETRITRLGQGVDAAGRLDAAAIDRTVAVIADYRARWEDAGVAPSDVRIVATAAVRDAANRDVYLAAVHEATGLLAEVASGDEEARLSFAGALGRVDVAAPSLLVDIGGGSTELVIGDRDAAWAAHSMQVGAVRVTERHLPSDPPTEDEAAAARAMVRVALEGAVAALATPRGTLADVRSLVGVAGTVATVGALHASADGPDAAGVHGVRVPAADVSVWAQRLLAMTTAERGELPGVPAGRADVVHAGALVLDEVVARTGLDAVVVSLADNLDGIVAALARGCRDP